MRYCPVPSEAAERTFSMSAGLAASTVTPGSTAPDESLTVPAITACAEAAVGMSAIHASNVRILTTTRITHLAVRVVAQIKRSEVIYLSRENAPRLLDSCASSRNDRRRPHRRSRDQESFIFQGRMLL